MAVAQTAIMRLDQYITLKMREFNVPAVSIALTDRDRTVFLSTDGVADVTGRMPVIRDTLFQIGALSKSFTALALMQAFEAGLLDLDAPVTEYLPWFQVQTPYTQPITPHHLLTHTAGIISGQNFTAGHHYDVVALQEAWVSAPPGLTFHYSNAGYKALGLILERVYHRSFAEIIQEHILMPLGMHATEPVITHSVRKRMAIGYGDLYDDRPASVGRPLAPAPWVPYGGGDASIASTPGDMAIYARMLLNRGEHANGRLISDSSFDQMITPYIQAFNTPGLAYGYALVMSELDGHFHAGHEGSMVGFSSALLLDMDEGLGVVVLSNHNHSPAAAIADFGLRTQRAARHGLDLPSLPGWNDPTLVRDPVQYAGVYRTVGREIAFSAEGGRLIMHYDFDEITLEARGEDRFFVPHADFERYLLVFGRDERGQVVELFYGGEHFVNDYGQLTSEHTLSDEWAAYLGRFRSHNPWLSNFSIVERRGQLTLIEPSGAEYPLVAVSPGRFRVGMDEYSPEWLAFDSIVEGQAMRVNYSGCDYYRFFTP